MLLIQRKTGAESESSALTSREFDQRTKQPIGENNRSRVTPGSHGRTRALAGADATPDGTMGA